MKGGCHCGAVRFEAEVPTEVEILDCNCSICAVTGFRHLIVPHADFTLLSGEDNLTSYRFGTGAANHLFFCGICGVKSFYQPRSGEIRRVSLPLRILPAPRPSENVWVTISESSERQS